MRSNQGFVDEVKDEICEIQLKLWVAVIQFSLFQFTILKSIAAPSSWITRAIVPVSLAILLVNGRLGISTIYGWATRYKHLLNQLDEAKGKHGAELARNENRRNVIMFVFMGLILVYAFLVFGYVVHLGF